MKSERKEKIPSFWKSAFSKEVQEYFTLILAWKRYATRKKKKTIRPTSSRTNTLKL